MMKTRSYSYQVILLGFGLGLGLLSAGCDYSNHVIKEIRVIEKRPGAFAPAGNASKGTTNPGSTIGETTTVEAPHTGMGTPPVADGSATTTITPPDASSAPTPSEATPVAPPTATPPASMPECSQDSDCTDGKICNLVDGVKRCTAPIVAVTPPLTLAPLAPAPVTAVLDTLVPLPFPTTGTIHSFARCVNPQGQGYLCHWSGSSEDDHWSSVWHDYQQDDIAQMHIDFQPAAVYQASERKIHVFAYSREGSGDVFGAGSLSWASCDVDHYACGAPQRVTSLNRVHYVPSAVALEGGRLFTFFNGGDGLYFLTRDHDTFSVEIRISSVLEDGQDPSTCGGVDFSPSAFVRTLTGEGEEIHAFAMTSGHRLMHAYLTVAGLRSVLLNQYAHAWRCETFDDVLMNSSPKAFVDPGNRFEINVAALDTTNHPQVWLLSGGPLRSYTRGPVADVTVSMPPSEFLGVAAVANPDAVSTFHIFYRLNDGRLGHVTTHRGEPNPGDPEAHGLPHGFSMIDSPTAVSDPAGNLHVFAGEPSNEPYSSAGHCGKSPQGEWQCRDQTYYRDPGSGCHGRQRWRYPWEANECDLRNFGDFVQTTDQGQSGMSALYVPITYNTGND